MFLFAETFPFFRGLIEKPCVRHVLLAKSVSTGRFYWYTNFSTSAKSKNSIFFPKHCCLHWGFATSTISPKTSGLKRILYVTLIKSGRSCVNENKSLRNVSLGFIVSQKQTNVACFCFFRHLCSLHHGVCGPSITLRPPFFLPSLLLSCFPHSSHPHLSTSAAHSVPVSRSLF